MHEPVIVALAIDKFMEVGLHLTAYSILENTSSKIKFYLFYRDFNDSDIKRLHESLKIFKEKYELKVIPIDDSQFKHFRSFYGNWMSYVRLIIPDHIEEKKAIYIDSDILVQDDISVLFNLSLQGKPIAARSKYNMKESGDNHFFIERNLDLNAGYFNAGVLLIDIEKWKENNYTSLCLKYTDNSRDKKFYFDQTILNAVFHNNFTNLTENYNLSVAANSTLKREELEGCYVHFIASPKPWDLFGEFKHNHYELFRETIDKTVFKGYNSFSELSPRKLYRFLRIIKTYFFNQV